MYAKKTKFFPLYAVRSTQSFKYETFARASVHSRIFWFDPLLAYQLKFKLNPLSKQHTFLKFSNRIEVNHGKKKLSSKNKLEKNCLAKKTGENLFSTSFYFYLNIRENIRQLKVNHVNRVLLCLPTQNLKKIVEVKTLFMRSKRAADIRYQSIFLLGSLTVFSINS